MSLLSIQEKVGINPDEPIDVVLIGGNFFDTDGVTVSIGKKIAVNELRDRVCVATSYGVADADGKSWNTSFSMTKDHENVYESTCAGSWALPASCRNLMVDFPIDEVDQIKPCGKIIATGIKNEDELKEAVEKALQLIG
jgi:uncharacterized protein YxjI